MSEFVDHLETVFALFGPVIARRMFGGYGIYHDALMFGLVADDEIYLKTDEKSVRTFTELGLPPFELRASALWLVMHTSAGLGVLELDDLAP